MLKDRGSRERCYRWEDSKYKGQWGRRVAGEVGNVKFSDRLKARESGYAGNGKI